MVLVLKASIPRRWWLKTQPDLSSEGLDDESRSFVLDTLASPAFSDNAQRKRSVPDIEDEIGSFG